MQDECVHDSYGLYALFSSYFLESLICSHSIRHLNEHDDLSVDHSSVLLSIVSFLIEVVIAI